MMKTLTPWWQSLVYRERLIVSALVVIMIVFLFQLMIWKPLYQGHENALNSVDKQAKLLTWMQSQAQLASQLKGNATATHVNGQSLSQRINTSAKQSKVTISRFQTAGDQSVQVWLEAIEFSSLMQWLEQIQSRYGIQLESISISETAQQGRVSVRAKLTEV